MAFYVSSSKLGADLNTTSPTALFALGETVEGSDGTLWEYVNASTSVSAYAIIAINASGTMAMASAADAVAGLQLAVAQTAFAASEYGWVPIRATGGATNQMRVLCSGTMSGGNALYVGSRTGVCSIQVSSSATLHGVMVYGASGADHATVTSLACIVSWPKCNYSGA